MATTTSTTTGFATARYSSQIRKDLLEFGPITHVWRQLADVGKLEPGHTNVYQVNRRRRIPLPLAAASEGATPTATSLQIDSVSGTASQYVLVTQFTDVAEIYQFHDLLEDAVIEVKDAMARLDDKIMSDAFLSGTNIIYPGAITTISSITAADILDTDMVRRAVAGLRTGSAIFGAAPRFAGNKMASVIHEDAPLDLQRDATWDQYASRQRPELQEKGIVNDWMGVLWYTTNFMPEYVNLNVVDSGTSAVTATQPGSADGGAGGTWTGGAASGAQNYVMVKKHQHRTFSEGITSTLTTASLTSGHKLSLFTPSDTTYVYDYYLNTASGGATLKLVSSNNAASATVTIVDYPASTAAVAPVAPAVGVNVLPAVIMGKGFASTVDLSALEVFITPRTPTPTDPAVQNRYVSAKFFLGAFLQQNAWGRVLYAATKGSVTSAT